jgi:hypothetical protein
LQLVGKIANKRMSQIDKKTSGRRTIDNGSLKLHRDRIVGMLSCWWGEVGWQLPRATTRDELLSALQPLKDHPDRHEINRLLLPSSKSATAEEIREQRRQNESAIKIMYEDQPKQRSALDIFTQTQMALDQALPAQMEAVNALIAQRKGELEAANTAYEDACSLQLDVAKELDEIEAGYAQDELLMFIKSRFIEAKKKFARNPENLANAIAGLPLAPTVPFMGAWQSYVRCSKLECDQHHRFQLFETIQSIWNKSRKSPVPLLKFFHQEITSLQKTVTVTKVDPITGEEFKDKALNMIRHALENDWPIWKLAIRKSFEFQVEIERVPFLICANFTKVQRDPGTQVALVLEESENSKTR